MRSAYHLPILICMLIAALPSFSQPALSKMRALIEQEEKIQPKGTRMNLVSSTQAGVVVKPEAGITPESIISWLSKKLLLRQNQDQLRDENRDVVTGDRYTVKKIHQYYKGIKVEHGIINVTSKNDMVRLLQMEFYTIPDSFSILPLLTETDALNKAVAFTGASRFEWENNPGMAKPKGELVIIQTYEHEDEVCLAYKFNIYALQPLYRAYVYVNAVTGKVVLDDAIIKHAEPDKENNYNAEADKAYREQHPQDAGENGYNNQINGVLAVNRVGRVETRFAGVRQFVTDSVAGGLAKPFRLHQGRNGHGIYTMNYRRRPYNPPTGENESLATDFTDNDNNWTAAEFDNPERDNSALDVHYNMQWVSDYYYNVHNRSSWDGNGAPLWCYVHVGENTYYNNGTMSYDRWYNNAFWNGVNMHFGDGDELNYSPKGYLDVCAHELSHAITEKGCALVYRWESGALNEALSDIWAACITHYAKQQDPTLTGEKIWRYGEKRDLVETPSSGLRDLQNPLIFNHPSTYGSLNWEPANYYDCPQPDFGNNDLCGVHNNSGVLNKWFFLITEGEVGVNTRLSPYIVTGLGFDKTEKLIYLMEQNLTPNANYSSAMEVSLNIAATEYGWDSQEFANIKNAWYAVGVDSAVYNTRNVAAFTSNNFTCITTSANDVFAGTNYSGLYRFDGTTWTKFNELTDVRFNDLKTDYNGDIWIAQSGRLGQNGGGSSIAGGVNWLKFPYTAPSKLFTVDPLLHVPSRNARAIYLDGYRSTEDTNSRVWVATLAYITSGNSTSGMLGQGLYGAYKEFHPVNQGINIAAGTVGCATVGGLPNEIWTFVQANNGVNQLLRYNADNFSLIGTFDHNSVSIIPSGFNVRALYGDRKNRMWIGLASGGILIYDEHKNWHYINFPGIFPAGTAVNYNAITGDPYGDVYIGTSSGLVFFDHGIGQTNRLDDSAFYRLYTKKNGLPSSNINAISYNSTHFKLWVATDSGIVAWKPLCLGASCNLHRFYEGKYAETVRSGNWSNPATWSSGAVPDSSTIVVVTDTVTVDIKGQCQSLTVGNEGSINVNTGQGLKVFEVKSPIMDEEQRRRRQR